MTDMAIVQRGWQCPCCRRVYSPSTPMCFTCGNEVVKKAADTGEVSPAKIRREANAPWDDKSGY